MPSEYWSLSPRELNSCVRGANQKHERDLRLVAWQTVHLLNVAGKSLKRPISMDDLLRPELSAERRIKDAEMEQQNLDELTAKFGLKKWHSNSGN